MSELMSRLSWLTYVWGWPYARSWTPNQEHLWYFWAWFVLLGQLSMLELAGAVYAIHWDPKTGTMWKLPTSWFPGSFVAKSFNEQATLTTGVCYDSFSCIYFFGVCFDQQPSLRLPRVCILIWLIESLGGVWCVEQPSSSLLRWHPRMLDLFETFQVFELYIYNSISSFRDFFKPST